MAVPILTDRYIIIRVASPEDFDQESLRTLWVDKENGIQEVMGKHLKHDKTEVQSYVFDKHKFTIEEARSWVKEKREKNEETPAELLVGKKSFVAGNMLLCTSRPNLTVNNAEAVKLTPESYAATQSQSSLNDRYYFYVEGVHEGMNGNGDYFFKDELTENYKTAGYQLIDWEHQRDQVIGFSLDSELITRPEEPLALAFTGVINRLSPHMQVEERQGDMVISRDELIRQRYFEGKLAVSMECFFDSCRCVECGYETDDPLDFEFHKMMTHKSMMDSGQKVPRGLVGVDYVGWGVVGMPADGEAYVNSLRTSDDGLIEDIIASSEDQERYGCMAENVAFAKMASNIDPNDTFFITNEGKLSFASDMINTSKGTNVPKLGENDKKTDDSTKTNNKPDKRLERTNIRSQGGSEMFNLNKKITSSMSLNDAIVVALKALKDFQGDRALQEEEVTAFATEFSEAVTPKLMKSDFRVADIYTLTDVDKLAAVDAAREDEKNEAASKSAVLQTQIESLTKEKEGLEATVSAKEEEIDTLKNAEQDRAEAEKVDAFIADVKNDGVELTETFEADMRTLAKAKLNDEEGMKKLKGDLLASVKRSTLSTASATMGDSSAGGDNADNTTMAAKLEKAREEGKK